MIPLRNIGALGLVLFFWEACQTHPLQHKLQHADKVEVSFYKLKEGHTHKKYKTLILQDQKLKLVRGGILSAYAPHYKCSYNGSMTFYHQSKSLHPEPMEFNITCSGHIVYLHRGKLHSLKLSPELKSYLKNQLRTPAPRSKATQ